jgi:hypothetical protein
MRHKFRLGRGARWLPALGATVALAVVPSVASAHRKPFDPSIGVGPVQAWWNGSSDLNAQTTNVPYLAWNGEEVRLESCVPLVGSYIAAESALGVDDGGRGFVPLTGITPSFIVEDWSGSSNASSNMAQMEPGTENVFLTDHYNDGTDDYTDGFPAGNTAAVCAEGDVTSEYPGMARVKLVVTANDAINQDFGQIGLGSAQNVFKTQYLAGWMTLNKPTLTELPAGGDPDGTGTFTPTDGVAGAAGTGFQNGVVDVKVKGTIPMNGSWSDALGGATSVTLPDQWATLAQTFATDSNPLDTTPYDMWDTSGDSNNTEGHPINSGCVSHVPSDEQSNGNEVPDAGAYVSQLDNGDNCYPGPSSDQGPFSSVIGPTEGPAVGPYDPVNSDATWIPDGDLNSQDAPMPAARVDFSIAQNSGGTTDISGVGSLVAQDKDVTFSRNGKGTPEPHNLYAPFYNEYIPATARDDVASGIDGSVITGDFPNFFQGQTPKYHFWQTAQIAANGPSQTACLNRTPDAVPALSSTIADNYPKPSGQYDAAVYTDQNGEAQVQYDPNTGFYLDNNSLVVKNLDHGCDLGPLFGKTVGTSAISATAKYPFQPGNFPAVTSNTVNKTVISHWEKTIGFESKGPSDGNNDNVKIVTVHAQNIDGSYDAHEIVCFSGQGASFINAFPGTDANGIDYSGETTAPDPDNSASNRLCLYTDDFGNAAIEVGSSGATVDVLAEFANEGLFRDINVPFGPGSAPTGGTPVTAGPTPPSDPGTSGTPSGTPTVVATGKDSGTTPPSLAKVEAVDPALAASIKHASKKAIIARVDSLRLVMPSHARHYLLVKVISGQHTARLALTFQVRKGHKTALVHRTLNVRTNRSLKIGVAKNVIQLKGAHLVG